MVVLDTNILIESLRIGSYSPILLDLSNNLTSGDIVISTISVQELYVGESTLDPKVTRAIDDLTHAFTILDYTEDQAKVAGNIMLKTKQLGYNVTFADIALAGVAVSLDASLVTLNIKHFMGVPGLKLFDISSYKK